VGIRFGGGTGFGNLSGGFGEHGSVDLWGFVMSRLVVSVAVVAVWALGAGPAVAEAETHCVVEVVGQRADGELVLSEPRCYSSFTDAVFDASGGVAHLGTGSSGAMLFEDGSTTAAVLASFTLGIHFDGFNGSGSSISVVGDSCTGGWWNTGTTWANRISSSWNGCYRLTHHDGPNKTGASESTVGVGATRNLTWLHNRAESVSYWSS
jgi:hypothetical protein